MPVNLQAERLYDQVELVRGSGSRKRGQLCIMSFVAYLAGERHTDRPRTASPFIRNFAIALNDGVSPRLRQDLKPYAPQIIGTNDGREFEREAVSFQLIMEEVFPRAKCDFLDGRDPVAIKPRNPTLLNITAPQDGGKPSDHVASLFLSIRELHRCAECLSLATRAGHVFMTLMEHASSPTAQRWYWAKALELLDRLCEVGTEDRAAKKVAATVRSIPMSDSSPVIAAQSEPEVQEVGRRPTSKISMLIRAALDLVSS